MTGIALHNIHTPATQRDEDEINVPLTLSVFHSDFVPKDAERHWDVNLILFGTLISSPFPFWGQRFVTLVVCEKEKENNNTNNNNN